MQPPSSQQSTASHSPKQRQPANTLSAVQLPETQHPTNIQIAFFSHLFYSFLARLNHPKPFLNRAKRFCPSSLNGYSIDALAAIAEYAPLLILLASASTPAFLLRE